MLRSRAMVNLVRPMLQLGTSRVPALSCNQSTMIQDHITTIVHDNAFENRFNEQTMRKYIERDAEGTSKPQNVQNMSKKGKISVLVSTLLDLKDTKEEVYDALDAWVASEQEFPIGRLKMALLTLEKKQQWHRVVQVIKWMLSKGQGVTVGTYGQLIHALDMDQRVEEANKVWVTKLSRDMHSVPWKVCDIVISLYYRNEMLEELVKLFKRLEAHDRQPPEKFIVQKVADSYERLGLIEEKERILEKYKSLFMKRQCRYGRTPHMKAVKSEAQSCLRETDDKRNIMEFTTHVKEIKRAL